MYNEQIENLINLALADGELSEKEKQILFKKAEAAGIDLDEFEMVLDAKLFEKQKPYAQLIQILVEAIEDGHISEEEKNDIIWFCKNYLEQNQYYELFTSKIQELHGLLEALSFDSILYDIEIDFLEKWLENHMFLRDSYPFDFVSNKVHIIKYEVCDETVKLNAINKLLELGKCFESIKLYILRNYPYLYLIILIIVLIFILILATLVILVFLLRNKNVFNCGS